MAPTWWCSRNSACAAIRRWTCSTTAPSWRRTARRCATCNAPWPPGVGAVIGYVDRNRGASGKHLTNAASLLAGGRILHSQAKTLLPAYDVFDESRYFEPAAERRPAEFKGERIGIAICEDIWWETEPDPAGRYAVDPVRDCLDQGATLLVAPSASPYYRGKPRVRRQLLKGIGAGAGVPVVYVNMVGGNDGLLFDGQSMVTGASGELVLQCAGFEEQLLVWDSEQPGEPVAPAEDDWPAVERALGMGIADYLRKTHHERVHVSVSGGIDSALVAALAARALGPERVTAFSLPSMYSSEGSKTDAALLCERLGVPMHTIPIEALYAGYERALAPVFAGAAPDITEENLQARIRGMLMMAYSNKTGSILLATGNKSELATGYSTLYGDLCGGLAPIGDLLKTEVYALARAINQGGEIIPEATLTKPPLRRAAPGPDRPGLPARLRAARPDPRPVRDRQPHPRRNRRPRLRRHHRRRRPAPRRPRRVQAPPGPHHPQSLPASLRHRPSLPDRPRNPRSLLTPVRLIDSLA